MKLRKRKNQKGFGLLELMLSMVIVALLLIMATRYYQSARSNARINEAVSLVQTIANAANNIEIGKGDYDGITNESVNTYLPASAQKNMDPWGGVLTIAGNKTTLTITMAGPGSTDCNKLVDALGSGTNDGSYMKYSCDAGTFTATESMQAHSTNS